MATTSTSINITPEELNDLLRTVIREELSSQPDNEPKRYRTRNETAKILHLSLPTLDQYTNEKLIEGSRIGMRVLYSEAAIAAAVKSIPQARYKRR